MGLEITRDHWRKMGEVGSSAGPVVQLCGSPRDLKPGFGELGDLEYLEMHRKMRQRTGAKG